MNTKTDPKSTISEKQGAGATPCSAVVWFHRHGQPPEDPTDKVGASDEVGEIDVVEWAGRIDVLQEFQERWADLDLSGIPLDEWVEVLVHYEIDEGGYALDISLPNAADDPAPT